MHCVLFVLAAVASVAAFAAADATASTAAAATGLFDVHQGIGGSRSTLFGYGENDLSNATLYTEFELLLRPGQGRSWPPTACADSDEGVAKRVTDTLGISSTSFAVIAKVFDTVVMLVNTTGMTAPDGSAVNATAMAEVVVRSINEYSRNGNSSDNATTAPAGPTPPPTVYDIVGQYFVGQCDVSASALDYTPVKVPGYLRAPEVHRREGFYALGGLAGLCVLLQAAYGLFHWRRFDLTMRDTEEQPMD